jgi:hypothetical protein
MANVVISWKDPTVKAGIEHVDIQASVDDQSYASIAHVAPGVQTVTDQDVQPGKWFYRAIVVPKKGDPSDPVKASIDVPFPKAGPVTDLKLSLS